MIVLFAILLAAAALLAFNARRSGRLGPAQFRVVLTAIVFVALLVAVAITIDRLEAR